MLSINLFKNLNILNNFFPLFLKGTNASALEKDIGPEQFPINEHYFGLVNVSTICSMKTIYRTVDLMLLELWFLLLFFFFSANPLR